MERPAGIPDALWQLMEQDGIKENELRYAVFKRGYFPFETPIASYGAEFINAVLIGAWAKVKALAVACRAEMPF